MASADEAIGRRSEQADAGARGKSAIGARFGLPSIAGLWLAGVMLLCLLYFPQNPVGFNGRAHIITALALVDHGTFSIDRYNRITSDVSYYHGHYFSNKAPGLAFFAVPVYWTLEHVAGMHVASRGTIPTKTGMRNLEKVMYMSAVLIVVIPTVLLLLLFFWFLGFYTSQTEYRLVLTLALGLGTMAFPYGFEFYSHIPVAGLLFAAFVLVWMLSRPGTVTGPISRWIVGHPHVGAFLAGLALGIAVLCEYDAGAPGLVIGLYALIRLRFRLWPALILGLVPGFGAIFISDMIAYGHPLVTGYNSDTSALYHTKPKGTQAAAGSHGATNTPSATNVSGFVWPPKLTWAGAMLFSPFRGIYFLSPFMLLSLPGLLSWRPREWAERALFVAVPAIDLLALSTFAGWHGGWAVGPRYFAVVLPFLVFPAIFILNDLPKVTARLIALPLVALSVFVVWCETMPWFGYPPASFLNPLFDFSFPELSVGDVRASWGQQFVDQWNTPDLRYTLLTLLPLVAVLGLWSVGCLMLQRRRAPVESRA